MQDLLTPKLASLLEQCRIHNFDFNAAESLAMLVQDATVQQILKVLLVYADSLEAVRPVYANSGIAPPCCGITLPRVYAASS